MWSVECGVWSVECGYSMERGAWSVERGVWVQCRVARLALACLLLAVRTSMPGALFVSKAGGAHPFKLASEVACPHAALLIKRHAA